MKTNKYHFCWTGINSQGKALKGYIEAANVALVKIELRKREILVKTIKKKPQRFLNTKIKARELTQFFRQLATMLKAGISLIQSFDFVAKSETNALMIYLIETIKNDIEAGLSLSEALANHPRLFNELVCNLIAAGEKTGKLDLILARIADYKEKMEAMKRQFKKSLSYPIIVLIIAFLVSSSLLIFVVPQFESLFKSFGAELPKLTSLIISLSNFLKSYWFILLLSLFALTHSFIYAKERVSSFNQAIDKLILKLPVLGPLLTKTFIARFARTLAICFSAGLPLIESLRIASTLLSSIVFREAIEELKLDLLAGESMQHAMHNARIFPNLVVQMVAIGEESGTLELMLTKIADNYEEEVNLDLENSINLLEPLIMAILGLMIGSLVIAMYLPIFKLGSVV